MSRITNTFTFGLCLASMFQTGLSLQLAEQESAFFDGISGDLPLTKCDMIVVSPTPLKGEMFKHIGFVPRCVNL